MDKDRKLNAFGGILGAIGVMVTLFALIILLNSINFLRGINYEGEVTLVPTSYQNILGVCYVTYEDEDYQAEGVFDTDDMENLEIEDIPDRSFNIYSDVDGEYHFYDVDKTVNKFTVMSDVKMPFTVPVIAVAGGLVIAIGGFVWCFKGKPTKELKEIFAQKDAEEGSENEGTEKESEETAENECAEIEAEEGSKEEGSEEAEKSEDEK